MMPLDVNTFIGGVPYRGVPHPEPAILVKVLAREGVRGAWVRELPSAFAADPRLRNEALIDALAPHAGVLFPVIAIRGDVFRWEEALSLGVARGAVAVRAYGDAAACTAVAARCGERRVPMMLTASLEGAAAAHFAAADAGVIRAALRTSSSVNVIVTGAERTLIEATEPVLTPAERARLWWEISNIAGPPADDLAVLIRAMGPGRFLYGSGWPLRLTQVPKANLELLPPDLAGTPLADVADLA